MIIIVGAGPAGLSTAFHLDRTDREFLVLESAAGTGGLCRSFELGGAVFDLGGHAFFTKHEYVRELLDQWCRPGIHQQPRQAWVYSHGTFVRYPFQSHLHGLPSDVVQDCLAGLFEAARRPPSTPQSMLDWIETSFGTGIASHFLRPYNEKVWAHPLSDIATAWTAGRVVTPDAAAIVAGALRPQDFRSFPNATVRYPAAGGFFELFAGIADKIGHRVRPGHEVRTVDLRHRTLVTQNGVRLDWDRLVSTMPLDELVRRCADLPDCCRQAAAELRWNSLKLVNLVFDGGDYSTFHRIYSADPDVCFHKLVLNSNSSARLRASGRFAVQAEISYSDYKPLDGADLAEQVRTAVGDMGIVDRGVRPSARSTVSVDRAYPIQTLNASAARKHITETLERYGVLCAGRFGEWRYINSDDAVMRGKQCAEELVSA
ncbi:protoporphyrinogen/coproporphyrinogen oxidase [Amycolatopsis sp. NPDC003676]